MYVTDFSCKFYSKSNVSLSIKIFPWKRHTSETSRENLFFNRYLPAFTVPHTHTHAHTRILWIILWIIDIKDYSNVIKLFRVTALVIRFVKNLFRKIKGDNLNFYSYVDAKEIWEAKVHWVKTNQLCLLKSDNYKFFEKLFFEIW